jgi:hypothetical protein
MLADVVKWIQLRRTDGGEIGRIASHRRQLILQGDGGRGVSWACWRQLGPRDVLEETHAPRSVV